MNKLLKDNKYASIGLVVFLVVSASSLSIFVIFNFGVVLSGIRRLLKILTPVIDGIALAYILTPLLNYIENVWVGFVYRKLNVNMSAKRKKQRRAISILLTYLIFAGLLIIFFRLVIPQLILSIRSIIYQLPRYINNLEKFVAEIFENNPQVESTVNAFITEYSIEVNNFLQTSLIPQMEDIIKMFSASVIKIIKALLNLLIGFIISVYLMFIKELLAGQAKKITYALYETREANKIISGVRYTHHVFVDFLAGKLIDSIIIGILCYVITRIAHIPYAELISVIVGVTNLIPFFGPYIGGIPSVLLVLMVDPLKALYFLIIIVCIQQFDGNILGPKILGDSTGLSSFWVVFSITVAGGLFGFAGLILGVPTFGVIYALIRYKVNRKLRHKNMPEDTAPYITVGSIEKDGTFKEYIPEKGRSFAEILGIKKKEKTSRELVIDSDDDDDPVPESVASNEPGTEEDTGL